MESSSFYLAQFEVPATKTTPIVAQYFDQDFLGDAGVMLKGFYESGQLWALLIGLVIGYGFKSFSSYG
ncbi:hypothetical protein [cf. Phormidesmis sp. LEGE 11477]|uniref:hypothetical protein n=1 Tax=cf. Phormidesmis sp. LEGE 11477 TaxID=1828680 RepID=UPI0018828699|nr:hypothetical protein [cf. Phormidesmis sp. LEGE 11477]MBE9059973.1 hypothetical protein [cf. Phormidesmis sp. LEGE 11477]